MMNQGVTIEVIQPEDNQAIYQLIRKILESYGLDQSGTAYTDPYLNQLYEFYQEEAAAEYWVLKKGEEIIGGVGIGSFGDYENIAELQKYYVKKEYQGYGYGTLLMNRALKFARNRGYEKVYIETMDVLDKANQIYKHFGFKSMDKALSGSEHGRMNRWFILELNSV